MTKESAMLPLLPSATTATASSSWVFLTVIAVLALLCIALLVIDRRRRRNSGADNSGPRDRSVAPETHSVGLWGAGGGAGAGDMG